VGVALLWKSLDRLLVAGYHAVGGSIHIGFKNMPPRLGDSLKHGCQACHLTLRRLADQVMKADGTPISPQSLLAIEVYHRVPSPQVLGELARVLELDDDALLASAGAADVVVRDDLEAHAQHTEAVIKLFRAAQQREFTNREGLETFVNKGEKGGRSPCDLR
jgi:hypothetical protein